MDLVIGLGETGRPLYNVLKATYGATNGYDLKDELSDSNSAQFDVDFLHICIPYDNGFVDKVRNYQRERNPDTRCSEYSAQRA